MRWESNYDQIYSFPFQSRIIKALCPSSAPASFAKMVFGVDVNTLFYNKPVNRAHFVQPKVSLNALKKVIFKHPTRVSAVIISIVDSFKLAGLERDGLQKVLVRNHQWCAASKTSKKSAQYVNQFGRGLFAKVLERCNCTLLRLAARIFCYRLRTRYQNWLEILKRKVLLMS